MSASAVRTSGSRREPWPALAALALAALGAAVAVWASPERFGLLVVFAGVGLVLVVLGLRQPVLACLLLLVTTFFRVAIPTGTFPVDPFLLAFAGVVASMVLWLLARPRRLSTVSVDPITCAIALYLAWNLISIALPHAYRPGAPVDPAPFSVVRFVLIGAVMPLVMFLVGGRIFVTERAIRVLLWALVVAAAYSALVSVLQFTAPALVWPRYITENTVWPGRAVGVFNQPEVNGMVLILGFLASVLVASYASERPPARAFAVIVAAGSVYGVYLTHTRAVWASFVLVVVLAAVLGRGVRRGFVITLFVVAAGVALGWRTLTGSDRSAGGVGSVQEVQDRLNTIATSVWAFERRPVTGWGVGRFASVNTYHHQSFSPEIPWARGYGIPSHLDALGILVELGIVGLVFWLVALVLIYVRLVRAVRSVPTGGMYGRSFVLTALLCLVAQTVTGLTVDLRFFDFPNIAVMLMAGAALGWSQRGAAAAATRVEARGYGDHGVARPLVSAARR